jgi:hypothetical protein
MVALRPSGWRRLARIVGRGVVAATVLSAAIVATGDEPVDSHRPIGVDTPERLQGRT